MTDDITKSFQLIKSVTPPPVHEDSVALIAGGKVVIIEDYYPTSIPAILRSNKEDLFRALVKPEYHSRRITRDSSPIVLIGTDEILVDVLRSTASVYSIYELSRLRQDNHKKYALLLSIYPNLAKFVTMAEKLLEVLSMP